jgi:hypothetical protein
MMNAMISAAGRADFADLNAVPSLFSGRHFRPGLYWLKI